MRGQDKNRDTRGNDGRSLQILQTELLRLVAPELKQTEVFFSLADKAKGLQVPSWVKAHLERHPHLYSKLSQGELVGISHSEENPTPRPVASARSSVLLIPVIDNAVLCGAIGLVTPMDGPNLSQECLETVRQFAHYAAPLVSGVEEIDELRQENQMLKCLLQMRTHLDGNIAHELRTPLAAVRGYARMILDGRTGEITSTQRDYLTVITENANRLINLVAWMSHVAEQSVQHFKLTQFDLRDVWSECVTMHGAAFSEKAVALAQHIPDEPFVIVGDRDKMTYVFNSLLLSAVKFTKREATILVEFSRGREREVAVKISDNGPGIPPELLGRIFDRSVNASPRASAPTPDESGLSLSGVHDVVGMHGGRIFVNSKPDQGATFLFTLPAVTADGEEKPGHEQAVNSSSRRR